MKYKIALFCLLGGLFFMLSQINTGQYLWWWLAGALMSASMIPVVRFGPPNVFAQFGIMALALVVVGIWCTMSEALVFFPETRAHAATSIVGGTVFYTVAAAWLAVLGRILKLNEASEQLVETRSAAAESGLVLAAGASYVVYYYVFGVLAFQLYTRQFYPHAAEQAAALGAWFPVYQWGRGLLMTLAVLPMILTLRMKRWQAALAVGLVVWIVGGAAPLLVPNAQMGTAQRMAHILEILGQNLSLGMTAVWLLRRKGSRAAAESRSPVAAVQHN